MEIYEALKRDHEELKGLLDELCSLKEDDEYRFVLIEEIRNNLVPHSRAEEAIFYNTLRAINADKKIVFHGYQDHLEAETLLRSLQLMDKLNLNWLSTAEKLREVIFQHVFEEESTIFDEARLALTSDEARAMTDAFEKLKPKVLEEGFIKNSIDMVVNLMPPTLTNKIRNFGGQELNKI